MTDAFDDYDVNDLDEIDQYADYFDEYEDERVAARGTSQCDGSCSPQCDWCLISHSCPMDCLGGPCPYESLDPSMAGERDRCIGLLDAQDETKRSRLKQGVSRRHYLHGFESWIRRNDPRRRAKEAAKRKREVDWSMVFEMKNPRRIVVDAIKSAWDIESPSRAFAEGMRQVAWDRVVFDGVP